MPGHLGPPIYLQENVVWGVEVWGLQRQSSKVCSSIFLMHVPSCASEYRRNTWSDNWSFSSPYVYKWEQLVSWSATWFISTSVIYTSQQFIPIAYININNWEWLYDAEGVWPGLTHTPDPIQTTQPARIWICHTIAQQSWRRKEWMSIAFHVCELPTEHQLLHAKVVARGYWSSALTYMLTDITLDQSNELNEVKAYKMADENSRSLSPEAADTLYILHVTHNSQLPRAEGSLLVHLTLPAWLVSSVKYRY